MGNWTQVSAGFRDNPKLKMPIFRGVYRRVELVIHTERRLEVFNCIFEIIVHS